MKTERLESAQIVDNELLQDSKGAGFLEWCSQKMTHQLGQSLMIKISDGEPYVVKLYEKYQEPEIGERTRLTRTLAVTQLILCKDCKYTPRISEEAAPYIRSLICHRTGAEVYPMGFCAWAEDRSDCVNYPWARITEEVE